MLKVDQTRFPHLKDDFCPLFGYDFSRMGKVVVDDFGVVEATDKDKFKEILKRDFQLRDAERFVEGFCKDFRFAGAFDPNRPEASLQFFFYDPRKNLDDFVWDFILQFDSFIGSEIAKRHEKAIDYGKLFDLKPNPIFPLTELLEQDPRIRSFERLTDGEFRLITIEDLQADVASILLISNVPEDVVTVFKRAKELYIFGYFRYDFFTISRHYACLALESAIKNRYYQSFGGREVILSNRRGMQVKMRDVDHQRIIDFCSRNRKEGWRASEVLVNGKKFCFYKGELLDWLIQNRIISMWERRLCEPLLKQRDFLSHQTFSPTDLPGRTCRILEEVGGLINKIYAQELPSTV